MRKFVTVPNDLPAAKNRQNVSEVWMAEVSLNVLYLYLQ